MCRRPTPPPLLPYTTLFRSENHVPFARQIREQLLIAWPRLAISRMPEWSENRGMASLRGRHVKVRCDVKSRPAFEHQLLDAIRSEEHTSELQSLRHLV